MLMTNGVGAIIGSYAAGAIVNHYVTQAETANWSICWFIFAGYAAVVGILFAIFFKDTKKVQFIA